MSSLNQINVCVTVCLDLCVRDCVGVHGRVFECMCICFVCACTCLCMGIHLCILVKYGCTDACIMHLSIRSFVLDSSGFSGLFIVFLDVRPFPGPVGCRRSL